MIAGRFTLDRYIGRTVVTSAVGALGVLVLLLTAFDFLDHLPAISRGRYGLADAALLTLLAMPRELSQVLSAAALLGVLLGLGGLASRSELVVMRATGWSPTRVLGSVLLAGLAFSALAAVS
ncbi:MAG TPA: LptF/LptG family permease, partial [Chromatiaceae bacterium]|nr:LptF/LptG family permease [Chromatiaceae bacterium]